MSRLDGLCLAFTGQDALGMHHRIKETAVFAIASLKDRRNESRVE